MAPTSKPASTSASKDTPTGNPAPDFTVTMNRIQTQLEARMKAARAFLPSRSDLHNNNAPVSSSTGSFSSLSGSSSNPQSQSRDAAAIAARRAAEEAEFAEERGLDPNAGIGLIRSSAAANKDASGTDRDTARLRGRLLGKRGRDSADKDSQQKWARKEDSSDEEAGRSGLGRAKRNGKRTRAEMEMQEDSDRSNLALATGTLPPPESKEPSIERSEAQVNPDSNPGDSTEASVTEPATATEPGSSQPLSSEHPKKKRKKKKKKKAREGTGGEHVV
ncbi:hypothetical protein Daesc_002994 [Daldinia eschscholtzii]|uniref:Uncharacterized protein n=1 Tax=Daldinia eschscholtzii TaxID=292717 RepID=A0AAX6MRW3_9PEZI